MKKKLLYILSVIMLSVMCIFSVSAAEKIVTVDGVTYRLSKNKTDGQFYEAVQLLDYNAEKLPAEINVVSEIGGIPVLSIDGVYFDPQFENPENYSVTKITLPEGLKYIEDYALSNFRGVEGINLPSTLEKIDTGAFRYMINLKSIIIPERATKIGSTAFSNCQNLSKVVFKGKVTFIGTDAFAYCTSLKKIELPETVKKICSGAFRGSGLLSVTIPEKALLSYVETFRDCKNLKTVIFDGCKREKGLTVGTRMFYGCTSLKKVCFPEETKCVKLSYETFGNCKNLKTICNSEKITKINEKAFTGCKNLKKINLGKTTKIGKNAFYNCPKLKTVTILNDETAPKIQKNAFKKTSSDIKFITCSKAVAKKLKTNLKNSGAKKFKVCYVKYVNV